LDFGDSALDVRGTVGGRLNSLRGDVPKLFGFKQIGERIFAANRGIRRGTSHRSREVEAKDLVGGTWRTSA